MIIKKIIIKKKAHSSWTFWTFDPQLQQLIVVEAGLVQILFCMNKKINKKTHLRSGTGLLLFTLLTPRSAHTSQIYTFKKMYKTRLVMTKFATCQNIPMTVKTIQLPANNQRRKRRMKKEVGEDSDVKSPAAEHQSLCSIFTFGGFRKDLFFFSLLFFPCAWKDLQLSTRPSRDSFVWFTEQIHLRSLQKPWLWNACNYTTSHPSNNQALMSTIDTHNYSWANCGTHLKVLLPFSLPLCFLCCLDLFLSCPFPEKQQEPTMGLDASPKYNFLTCFSRQGRWWTPIYRSCISFASLSFLLISSSANSFMVCLYTACLNWKHSNYKLAFMYNQCIILDYLLNALKYMINVWRFWH